MTNIAGANGHDFTDWGRSGCPRTSGAPDRADRPDERLVPAMDGLQPRSVRARRGGNGYAPVGDRGTSSTQPFTPGSAIAERLGGSIYRPAQRGEGVRRSDSLPEGNHVRDSRDHGVKRSDHAPGSGDGNNRFLQCRWPRRARIALWFIAAGMASAAVVIVVMTPAPTKVSATVTVGEPSAAPDHVAAMSSRLKRF